jgi:hypothetical protein
MSRKKATEKTLIGDMREAKNEQLDESNRKIGDIEKKAFLKDIFSKVEDRFKYYEKGYRTFSIKIPNDKHFIIDDEMIDLITNSITKKYECDYRSLSLTEVIYPKSYTLMFHKEKDISKNL